MIPEFTADSLGDDYWYTINIMTTRVLIRVRINKRTEKRASIDHQERRTNPTITWNLYGEIPTIHREIVCALMFRFRRNTTEKRGNKTKICRSRDFTDDSGRARYGVYLLLSFDLNNFEILGLASRVKFFIHYWIKYAQTRARTTRRTQWNCGNVK